RICCRELKESVSSASIGDPVIVPAIERMPKGGGTEFTSIGSSPPPPATMSWPRGASLPRSGDMDLLFAVVARIGRGGPTLLPPEGGVPFPRRNAAFRRQRIRPLRKDCIGPLP